MRLRILALSVAVAVAGASCSSAHHDAVPPTTLQPAAPNPDVIPAVITPAYVNAVFVVLNHIQGNATRTLVSANAVTSLVIADLRALYNDPLYAREVEIAGQTLQGGLANFQRPPGDIVTTVVDLQFASSSCIFVETSSQFRQVVIRPEQSAAAEYWRLSPKEPAADPHHFNPTPWALSFNATYLKATTIPNQCAS